MKFLMLCIISSYIIYFQMKRLSPYSLNLIINNINYNDVVRFAKSWQKRKMAIFGGIHFECPRYLAKRHV